MHFVAAASRSCEEFRARERQCPKEKFASKESGYVMAFKEKGRGKWVRVPDGPLTVSYNAAGWAALSSTLRPWDQVVTFGLAANRQ